MRTAATLLLLLGLALGASAEPALTLYNQNFAVVRETLPLQLERGLNTVESTDVTAHVEPDSVMLRDPAGKRELRILEQNYRADPVSQELLLSLYEGEWIDFISRNRDGDEIFKRGRIVRSGYVPHYSAMTRMGQGYAQRQNAMGHSAGQPIIEIDGALRFGLPGQPVFPALKDDTILKPTLKWQVATDRGGPLDAELAYVSGGFNWEASYNLVLPEKGDTIDLTAWVTMENQSGKTFKDARIKLMAGDVQKLQPQGGGGGRFGGLAYYDSLEALGYLNQPAVTEKAFDEYHLYTVARPTTLHDREMKQVEMIRAEGVESNQYFVYDGAYIDPNRYRGWNVENRMTHAEFGEAMQPKVWVMREFENTDENELGMPLPAGRTRLYRRDADGQLEFTGEAEIDHTPQGETVTLYTGNAFDIVGERKRTNYQLDHSKHTVDEDFEITVRNRKSEPIEVRVIEHLYRGLSWKITQSSQEYEKKSSQAVEFRLKLDPDEEGKITYHAHYTW